MTFFFRSLPISCEIIPLLLVLCVTRKGSLCGALWRNPNFNLWLIMSTMYLSKVMLFQFSRTSFMLSAWKLSTSLITFYILSVSHFLISGVYPLVGSLISVLKLLFVSPFLLLLLFEEGFCWNNSSRKALEVFWVFLVMAKIGTVITRQQFSVAWNVLLKCFIFPT